MIRNKTMYKRIITIQCFVTTTITATAAASAIATNTTDTTYAADTLYLYGYINTTTKFSKTEGIVTLRHCRLGAAVVTSAFSR